MGRKTDLANEFLNLQLQMLAIIEELKSDEMLKHAMAISDKFFEKIDNETKRSK